MRDHRREASRPKSTSEPVTIDPNNSAALPEHATLLSKSASPLPHAPRGETNPEKPAMNGTVIIVMAGLILAVVVRLIWGRN